MATPSHARTTLDHDLQVIRDDVLRLGSLVEQSLERAFAAFKTHDASLAQDVINDDQVINDLRYKAEHEITSTVALQQPMAHDLRLLVASLIIANELERMGDHMEGIARTVLRQPAEPGAEIPAQLLDMRQVALRMLREAMDAYLAEDVERASLIAETDNQVDALYQDLFTMLVNQMGQGALSVERGTYLLWAGHNLERYADRVTNICERVIYLGTGRTGGGLNPKPGESSEG